MGFWARGGGAAGGPDLQAGPASAVPGARHHPLFLRRFTAELESTPAPARGGHRALSQVVRGEQAERRAGLGVRAWGLKCGPGPPQRGEWGAGRGTLTSAVFPEAGRGPGVGVGPWVPTSQRPGLVSRFLDFSSRGRGGRPEDALPAAGMVCSATEPHGEVFCPNHTGLQWKANEDTR